MFVCHTTATFSQRLFLIETIHHVEHRTYSLERGAFGRDGRLRRSPLIGNEGPPHIVTSSNMEINTHGGDGCRTECVDCGPGKSVSLPPACIGGSLPACLHQAGGRKWGRCTMLGVVTPEKGGPLIQTPIAGGAHTWLTLMQHDFGNILKHCQAALRIQCTTQP